MIERYSRPQMAAIWSLEAQFRTWLDIEVLACEGWAKAGKIPKAAMEQIRSKAEIQISRSRGFLSKIILGDVAKPCTSNGWQQCWRTDRHVSAVRAGSVEGSSAPAGDISKAK